MDYKLLIVLYLNVASICSAPIQLQVLPLQHGRQPQLPFLRQNLLPNMQSPLMYQQQPMMIILPNTAASDQHPEANDRYINLNEQNTKNNLKSNTGIVDENKDAVVIDANPKTVENENMRAETTNALVYLPNEGRFSIGQIISYIPFLPIEINVPDTISWIGNLISGGWFRPQITPPTAAMTRLSNKSPAPVFVMPQIPWSHAADLN